MNPITKPIASPKEYVGQVSEKSAESHEYVYTPIEGVLRELRKRRKNQRLREQIEGAAPCSSFPPLRESKSPRALLFRQLATPTHEILRFLNFSKQLGLKPLFFEYYGDKFVSTGNPYKRLLGKMPIYQHTGSDGTDIVKYKTVLDFNKYTGKKISEVKCLNGESLIEFHHRLLTRVAEINPKVLCADATEWLHSCGNVASQYYKSFFTLFLRDAILFENFCSTPDEDAFFKKTVFPAFLEVEARYGFRPLIVRLLPSKEETRKFWDSYPKKTERLS